MQENIKLGLIVRMDDTGLGNQTRNLFEMLNPSKILVINSASFKDNIQQHHEWYDKHPQAFVVKGFPTDSQLRVFLKGINVLFSCETFYSLMLPSIAENYGVKTILQYNWEFLDYLNKPYMPKPNLFLSPSYWHLNDVEQITNNFMYLPPPINENKFEDVRKYNTSRANNEPLKILHVVGKQAVEDRNGTKTVIDAMKYVKSDVELTIKSQDDITRDTGDTRIKYLIDNTKDEQELYRDYDVILIPRRYGGLCLPMNEALMCGVIPIMTDIDPNNIILPKKWLIPSKKIKQIQTRSIIDVYKADEKQLAAKIDEFAKMDLTDDKKEAIDIAMTNFSFNTLKNIYLKVIEGVVNG